MRIRKEITEVFSTFVQFELERWNRWVVDGRLRRSMQRCLKDSQSAPNSESFWSLYWFKIWKEQASDLGTTHLTAYLQEPCYWAAQRSISRFADIQYTLQDYFQIAIAETNTVLERFNPDKGASLKTYAGIAFPSLLRDILQQRHEAELCSNWGLLHKVSKKRFIEALRQAGLSPDAIAQYHLIWVCFRTLHVRATPTAQLPKPEQDLWQAIATLYNSERQSQLTSPGTACDPQTVEQRLTRCSNWIRSYLHPSVQSLNVLRPGQDSGEIQDDLPSTLNESLLTEIIAQEDTQNREAQQAQITSALSVALEQLDVQSQKILQLYYKQNLPQQQIAQQLELSQPTVGRRLSKAREALLISLVQWSQNVLNISPTSTLIKDMSLALEEWLKVRYVELHE